MTNRREHVPENKRLLTRHGLSTVAMIIICLIVSFVGVIMVPVMLQEFEAAKQFGDEAVALSSLRSVVDGLGYYRKDHGNYPLVLEDLMTPPGGEKSYVLPEALEVPGYQYEYVALGDKYVLRLAPRSGNGRHYFADQSRVIRQAQDTPADEFSPESAGPLPRETGG